MVQLEQQTNLVEPVLVAFGLPEHTSGGTMSGLAECIIQEQLAAYYK